MKKLNILYSSFSMVQTEITEHKYSYFQKSWI